MVYRRRYRRYRTRRALKSVRYANETQTYTFTNDITSRTAIGQYSAHVPIIPAAATQGIRKVKNFTLTIAPFFSPSLLRQIHTSRIIADTFRFALVFVPEGQNPGDLGDAAADHAVSFYEPNQNVILTGEGSIYEPVRLRTRLARNLNSGDSIHLIIELKLLQQFVGADHPDHDPPQYETVHAYFQAILNYAITYN